LSSLLRTSACHIRTLNYANAAYVLGVLVGMAGAVEGLEALVADDERIALLTVLLGRSLRLRIGGVSLLERILIGPAVVVQIAQIARQHRRQQRHRV
jgi:hypothetical protein